MDARLINAIESISSLAEIFEKDYGTWLFLLSRPVHCKESARVQLPLWGRNNSDPSLYLCVCLRFRCAICKHSRSSKSGCNSSGSQSYTVWNPFSCPEKEMAAVLQAARRYPDNRAEPDWDFASKPVHGMALLYTNAQRGLLVSVWNSNKTLLAQRESSRFIESTVPITKTLQTSVFKIFLNTMMLVRANHKDKRTAIVKGFLSRQKRPVSHNERCSLERTWNHAQTLPAPHQSQPSFIWTCKQKCQPAAIAVDA